MGALDGLAQVDSFFGSIDLKTGSTVIAALGIVHPIFYGCTFFMNISYLLVGIWVLVALYFGASVVLAIGVVNGEPMLCTIYVWFSLIFVVLILLSMILLAIEMYNTYCCYGRMMSVLFAIAWYILTIYFTLVVNSYRQKMEKGKTSS